MADVNEPKYFISRNIALASAFSRTFNILNWNFFNRYEIVIRNLQSSLAAVPFTIGFTFQGSALPTSHFYNGLETNALGITVQNSGAGVAAIGLNLTGAAIAALGRVRMTLERSNQNLYFFQVDSQFVTAGGSRPLISSLQGRVNTELDGFTLQTTGIDQYSADNLTVIGEYILP